MIKQSLSQSERSEEEVNRMEDFIFLCFGLVGVGMLFTAVKKGRKARLSTMTPETK